MKPNEKPAPSINGRGPSAFVSGQGRPEDTLSRHSVQQRPLSGVAVTRTPEAVDLFALRRELGGTVYDGGRRWAGPGPGHSRRDASLSVWIAGDGRTVVHSFAGDDWRDCLKHIGIDPGAASHLAPPALAKNEAEREASERARRDLRLRFCRKVWIEAKEASGTPVEAYLASRGIGLPRSKVLRFHKACPLDYQGARSSPAMVAIVQDATGAATGIHVTAIRPDGSAKQSGQAKLMFGTCRASAVRLLSIAGPDLAVAEGIETALAFASLNAVPTWAALSTAGLRTFRPPPTINRLIIAADADDGGAGIDAARELAARACARCAVVILAAPDGQDWNDVLQGACHD